MIGADQRGTAGHDRGGGSTHRVRVSVATSISRLVVTAARWEFLRTQWRWEGRLPVVAQHDHLAGREIDLRVGAHAVRPPPTSLRRTVYELGAGH